MLLCLLFVVAIKAQKHPSDPLNEDKEASLAKQLLMSLPNFPKKFLFLSLRLKEPPKKEIVSFVNGTNFSL